MKTSFLTMLTMVLLGTFASLAPSSGWATSFQDADYTRIEVPEMTQAVKFFTAVLGCEPIGPRLESARSSSLLLACTPGSVVELTTAPTSRRSGHPGNPIQLMSDDPVATAHSLRQKGMNSVGKQRRLASGQTAVDLVAPWGLRLQLVSRVADARIATP